jgi:hypothetical protein
VSRILGDLTHGPLNRWANPPTLQDVTEREEEAKGND